eukprot:4747709-Prymnesium_polylepis.1
MRRHANYSVAAEHARLALPAPSAPVRVTRGALPAAASAHRLGFLRGTVAVGAHARFATGRAPHTHVITADDTRGECHTHTHGVPALTVAVRQSVTPPALPRQTPNSTTAISHRQRQASPR